MELSEDDLVPEGEPLGSRAIYAFDSLDMLQSGIGWHRQSSIDGF